ncbi:MAG TPA: hypothetical protein P5137_17645 [Candidatus Brocadiia bacterium]|nr:hypothetical protein [Candidatus Brocadiia bacterium]
MAECSCRITTHGERQLEVNAIYPLDPADPRTAYRVDLYLFFPYQLGVTEKTYGVSRFLADLRTYPRHTPPAIPLARLVDPACEASPLTRIAAKLKSMDLAGRLDDRAVLYEIQSFANIFHVQARDTWRLLRSQLRHGTPADAIAGPLKALFDEMAEALDRFRALFPSLIAPGVPESLRQAYHLADEAVSLNAEKTGCRCYQLTREYPGLEPLRAFILQRITAESAHRARMGYATVVSPSDEVKNETVVYRTGMVKKWAESCMYMNRKPARLLDNLAQILLGMAAGAAMLFAVVATIIATRWFAINSLPWVMIIVVSYIFKDRIKEILRAALLRRLPRLVADQVEDLIDPRIHRRVGRSRARVHFTREDRLPSGLRAIRDIEGNAFHNILPPEDVIHFQKDITLDSPRLYAVHTRLDSITEILRLRVDSWLAGMDDPTSALYCVEHGEPQEVQARRVYHVNMIVGFTRPGAQGARYFRHRLVLNRQGIVRIEQLETSTSAASAHRP